MKIRNLVFFGLVLLLLAVGCSKIKEIVKTEAVVCDEWTAGEGTNMGSAWGACRDQKEYELACDSERDKTGWNCSCLLNGEVLKTFPTTEAFGGNREAWTATTNEVCGWNLSPR